MTGRIFPTYYGVVDTTPIVPSTTPSAPAEDEVFAALASPVRREILRLLRERGPQPVQDLASCFAMARPSLSEHLRVLREAGLVSERRDGRRRLYRLEAAPFVRLRDWLDPYERFWRGRLSDLRRLLDEGEETEETETTGDAGRSPDEETS